MSCDGYVAVSLFLNENSCKYAILRDEFPLSVAAPSCCLKSCKKCVFFNTSYSVKIIQTKSLWDLINLQGTNWDKWNMKIYLSIYLSSD